MNTAARLCLSALLTASCAHAAERIDLGWLAGAWCAGNGSSSSEEHWLPARGGLMLAMNRSISEQGTQFEFMRIELADGGARLLAQPGGKPAVAFELVEAGPNRVSFANPRHDFPKRVSYARNGDELTARVDDGTDGSAAIEYAWKKCPAL